MHDQPFHDGLLDLLLVSTCPSGTGYRLTDYLLYLPYTSSLKALPAISSPTHTYTLNISFRAVYIDLNI